MSGAARGLPARIGIAALNLLTPGLGLLRVQRPRAAIAFLFAPVLLLGFVTCVYAFAPTLNFRAWAVLVGILLVALLLIYIGSIAMSWRASRIAAAAGPWWSRWYGIAGVFFVFVAIGPFLSVPALGYYRTFYTPAEAMAPTLLANDRLLASMRGAGDLGRGDIILFDVGQSIYVKRVAALPGDRIAMIDGVVILNGRPVAQRYLRTDHIQPGWQGSRARRLAERFPGEATPHEIYDTGYSQGDDMEERLVAPGHVFVLGDNRDMSADSRFSREEMGVEQLPVRDIRGRALFYLWGPSGRMGEPINH
jgi:signal peptidase I